MIHDNKKQEENDCKTRTRINFYLEIWATFVLYTYATYVFFTLLLMITCYEDFNIIDPIMIILIPWSIALDSNMAEKNWLTITEYKNTVLSNMSVTPRAVGMCVLTTLIVVPMVFTTCVNALCKNKRHLKKMQDCADASACKGSDKTS